MAESIKSKYKPSYPKKYKGDPNNIICRSSWERKFCHWCDLNESILEWGSEEFYIPYISPVDKRIHRYCFNTLYQSNIRYDKNVQLMYKFTFI